MAAMLMGLLAGGRLATGSLPRAGRWWRISAGDGRSAASCVDRCSRSTWLSDLPLPRVRAVFMILTCASAIPLDLGLYGAEVPWAMFHCRQKSLNSWL